MSGGCRLGAHLVAWSPQGPGCRNLGHTDQEPWLCLLMIGLGGKGLGAEGTHVVQILVPFRNHYNTLQNSIHAEAQQVQPKTRTAFYGFGRWFEEKRLSGTVPGKTQKTLRNALLFSQCVGVSFGTTLFGTGSRNPCRPGSGSPRIGRFRDDRAYLLERLGRPARRRSFGIVQCCLCGI